MAFGTALRSSLALWLSLGVAGVTAAQATSAASVNRTNAVTASTISGSTRRGAAASPRQARPSQPTTPQLTLHNSPPPPSAPHVAFRDRMLSIHAHNSTLGDVLSAVHQRTGAALDLPGALTGGGERVTVDLGPAPAEQVLASLLNGSNFDYVILGRPEDALDVQLIMLREKSGGEGAGGNNNNASVQQPGQIQIPQNNPPPDAALEPAEDVPTAEIPDDAPPTPPDAEIQNQQNPDQTPKTPEQLLQELKQMQQQQQPQQQPGQQPQLQGPQPPQAQQPIPQ